MQQGLVHLKWKEFWKNMVEKYQWIHLLFWLLYSIYLFANPALYKWGLMPVLFTGLAFYLAYGGAYIFTIKVITPHFFVKERIGRGLLLLLVVAALQQLIFGPISNYFLPFNNPFLEWFLFNLPFSYIILLLAAGVSVFTDYLFVVRKVQALELLKARQEIFLLKSQINPHFLFNTLNSLYALARAKSEKAEIAILQLSDLMRYLTEISQREFVWLSDEIRFLESYIEMEKLRLNDDAVCVFHISPNSYEQFKLPPLLLLPFVENAFKHGVELNTGKVNIHFYLTVQDHTLYFEVVNSFAPIKTVLSTGIGLSNIRKRLELIFDQKFDLEIIESDLNFTSKLAIELP